MESKRMEVDENNNSCKDGTDELNLNQLNLRIPLGDRPLNTESSNDSPFETREFANEFWRVNERLHEEARLQIMQDEAKDALQINSNSKRNNSEVYLREEEERRGKECKNEDEILNKKKKERRCMYHRKEEEGEGEGEDTRTRTRNRTRTRTKE